MSYKEQWKAKRRLRRTAVPPIHPLPIDEIDRRFDAMDARAMLYFPERELDFATLGHVLGHAALGSVRELWIDDVDSLDDRCLALISASPVEKLEVLGLRGWTLNDTALSVLLDAPALAGLIELELSPGNPNPYPWSSLRLNPRVPPTSPTDAKLQRLLFGYRCSPTVARILANHAALAGLQTLNLAHTKITDTEITILATARNLVNLRSLNLSSNDFGPAGAAALAAAPWPALEKLELVGVPLGADGMQALGARTGLPKLRELSLASNGLPDIEWEVKASEMDDYDRAQWVTDNKGAKPPTQDYIERRAVSSLEIAERFFPGQSIKIS